MTETKKPRLLVIGGSGLVGSIIVPSLTDEYVVRILDPRRPAYDAAFEFEQGGSTDFDALERAFVDVDAFIYMAMGPKDPAIWELPKNAALQFDMAVTGLYLATRAAIAAGVTHGIYASSMSVFGSFPDQSRALGDHVPDATDFYGLAKRLGEEVVRAATTSGSLNMVSLRLSLPSSDEDWLAATDPIAVTIGTAGTDVVSAFRAALEWRGSGFEPVAISGDRYQRYSDLSRAKNLLGWVPTITHPLQTAPRLSED